MRTLILMLATIFSCASWAGDKVGNGGGLWACYQTNSGLAQGMLVDLYEARQEFGLNIPSALSQNPLTIVQDKAQILTTRSPELSKKLAPVLSDVISKIHQVDSELVVVDDALFRVKPNPSSCPTAWQYVQFANFTNLGQVLVRKELWDSLVISSLDKAALIWHEAIYKWLRDTQGDKDSIRARVIVGLLFSDLSDNEFNKRVNDIMSVGSPVPTPNPLPEKNWVCIEHNPHISQWYIGFGINKLDGETSVKSVCLTEQEGFFCDESSLRCEEIKTNAIQHVCEVKNNLDQKVYSGQGRNLLEAEFAARNACQRESGYAFHCAEDVKCQ